MKNLALKQSRRKISIRREYKEINRLRRSYERQLNFRLITLFSNIGSDASNSFSQNGQQGFQVFSGRLLSYFQGLLQPFYLECITAFAKRMFNQRTLRKATEDYDSIYKTFMLQIGATRIADISETTRRIIAKIILDNRQESVVTISNIIKARFGVEFTRARSSTIARTETHTASSFAIQKMAENFNEPTMRKRWVSSGDERTRLSHVLANGQEVNIDDEFTVGGKKMGYTGDPKGGASEVVNCRCVIVYTESEDIVEE